jgi:hypothetical protein
MLSIGKSENHFLITASGNIPLAKLCTPNCQKLCIVAYRLQKVLQAYATPVRADKIKEERIANLAFSKKLDILICDFVRYGHRYEKATEFQRDLLEEEAYLFEVEQVELHKHID